MTDLDWFIIDALMTRGPLTEAQIVKHLERKRSTCYRAIRRLL